MKEGKRSIYTNQDTTRKTLISTLNDSMKLDVEDMAGQVDLLINSDSDGEEINLKVRETKAKHKSAFVRR